MNKDNKGVQFLIAFIGCVITMSSLLAICYGLYKLGEVIHFYFGNFLTVSYYVVLLFSFGFACEVVS